RSTMRFFGTFRTLRDFRGPKEGSEANGLPRERVRASLLPVDDADGGAAFEAGGADRLDRLEQRAAGGDDVLDQAHTLTLVPVPLDPALAAVALRLLADDQEGDAGGERGGRRE